ncbi:MAG: amphi-Trp domain-containing protein [Methylococcaceae bacterium]|nr:amphi-Trp domain-containing protein [Methylococcaceae bacterium]
MKQLKKSFRHDSLQDTQSITQILSAINEGLENGKLVFSDDEDEIVLNPKGLLQLKVSATQDDNKHSFSFKVSWQSQDRKINKKNKLKVQS